MHKAIVLMIVAIMMLAMPELLNVSMQTIQPVSEVAASGNLGSVVNSVQSSMKGMVELISVISYIAGLCFAIKAALALKEYNEGGYYREEKTEVKEVRTEKKEVKIEEPKIEKKVTLSLPQNRTGDKELDALIIFIEKKSAELLNNPQIQSDIPSKLNVEKSLNNYMPKVVNTYNNIPIEMRSKKINTNNAYEMTKEQLNLIISGLEEVDLNLLTRSHDKLRVNEKILKQVFSKSDIELEM